MASEREVGLCFTCRHARLVPSRRAEYWMCRLSAIDPRFPRYPRLPVLVCDGYRRRPEDAPPAGGSPAGEAGASS